LTKLRRGSVSIMQTRPKGTMIERGASKAKAFKCRNSSKGKKEVQDQEGATIVVDQLQRRKSGPFIHTSIQQEKSAHENRFGLSYLAQRTDNHCIQEKVHEV
jgi:hypothetical protein